MTRRKPRSPDETDWAAYIAGWRRDYERARRSYIEGTTSRVDASAALSALGYRQQALDIELLVWAKDRDDERKKTGRA